MTVHVYMHKSLWLSSRKSCPNVTHHLSLPPTLPNGRPTGANDHTYGVLMRKLETDDSSALRLGLVIHGSRQSVRARKVGSPACSRRWRGRWRQASFSNHLPAETVTGTSPRCARRTKGAIDDGGTYCSGPGPRLGSATHMAAQTAKEDYDFWVVCLESWS